MEAAVVVDAVRTPIGRYGGALRDVRPDDLAAHYNLAVLYRRMGLKDKAAEQAALTPVTDS